MDVGHRVRRGDDAGQVGDVGDLLDCSILGGLDDQLLGGEHDPRHQHPVRLRDLPTIVVEAPEVHSLMVSHLEAIV